MEAPKVEMSMTIFSRLMNSTSCDPVRTALRMLMEDENVSGCGEEGADMLLVWEEQEAWSSDK